jgi:hypothetical protein
MTDRKLVPKRSSQGESPWASGPGEILQHGVSLLAKDSDKNRRLGMLSIDNAVELMLKTYLGLPRRVTGIALTRTKFAEISESFPALLDAIEEHAPEIADGVDLGAVEWFHRLRNELYHQGNGLTVEREKVEVYAELAKSLFSRLFNYDLQLEQESPAAQTVGQFLSEWERLRSDMVKLAGPVTKAKREGVNPSEPTLNVALTVLLVNRVLTEQMLADISRLQQIRNDVAHARGDYSTTLTPEVFETLRRLRVEIEGHLAARRKR